jgi:hypothetical protein
MTSDNRQMSEARQVLESGYLEVDADLLKQRVLDHNDPLDQKAVKDARYICYCCKTRVRPVAIGLYRPGTTRRYKNQPSFALYRNEFHEEGCGYIKQTNDSEVDIDHEGVERIPLGRYPSRLSLDWLNLLNDINTGSGSRTHVFDVESNIWRDPNSTRDWAPSNIRPLVKHFLEPENRDHRLIVPNVDVKTYDRVFEKIYFVEDFIQNNLRIYFSQFIYSRISILNKIFTFLLTDGSYESDVGTPMVKLRLVVDARNWAEQDIRSLITKVFNLRDEAHQLRDKRELQKGKSLPWIFFLGFAKPKNGLPSLLCDDLRLIELCITDKLNDIPENPPYQKLQHEPFCDSNEHELNEPSLDEEDDRVNFGVTEPSSLNTEVRKVSESSFDEHELTDTGEYVESVLQQPEPDIDVLIINEPVQDISEPVISEPHQSEYDIEPPDIAELEHSQMDEEPTRQGQQRTRPDQDLPIDPSSEGVYTTRATRTKARRRKQRRILRKKAWKAAKSGFRKYVKPLIEQLIRFLRKR